MVILSLEQNDIPRNSCINQDTELSCEQTQTVLYFQNASEAFPHTFHLGHSTCAERKGREDRGSPGGSGLPYQPQKGVARYKETGMKRSR